MLAHNGWLWLQVFAVAFFGSLAVTGFMSAAGLGDAPNTRSAHSGVVPTAGGVGIVAGLGLALCATAIMFPGLNFAKGMVPIFALIFAVAGLGLTDDVLALGPKLKFAVMLLICGAAVWSIGPPLSLPGFGAPIAIPSWLGFTGAVLWVFGVMNVVNFMDGANGMIGLSLSIAFFALFGVGLIAGSGSVIFLSAMMLAVLLGFLPYNVRKKAQVFCGDVGSLTLGFGFAVTILFLVAETPSRSLHFVGPLLILPFLLDTILTVARRARDGEKLLHAHNRHLYQRLLRSGRAHPAVSGFYAVASLALANFVVVGTTRGWVDHLGVFLLALAIGITGYTLLSRILTDTRNHKSG